MTIISKNFRKNIVIKISIIKLKSKTEFYFLKFIYIYSFKFENFFVKLRLYLARIHINNNVNTMSSVKTGIAEKHIQHEEIHHFYFPLSFFMFFYKKKNKINYSTRIL